MKKGTWNWLILAGGIVFYLLITFTNPLSTHHVLYNLEPYPDGLFYVSSALSLAKNAKFEVSYLGNAVQPRITPLYPIFLAIGYVFNARAPFFYATNVALGIGTLVFLFLSLREVSRNFWLILLGLSIYLAHGYVYWLVSLPMAENLSLFLFAVMMFGLLQKKLSFLNVILTSAVIGSLVLTKYTLIGPTVVAAAYLFWRVLKQKEWKKIAVMTGIFLILAVLFLTEQLSMGFNPFASFTTHSFNQPSAVTGSIFYSFHYFVPNTLSYVQSLIGVRTNFLWLTYPFTTFGLMIFFGIGNLFLLWKKKLLHSALFLCLFFSQLPILLIFYVTDERYLIVTLPLLALGVVYVFSQLERRTWLTLLLCAAIALQVVSQLAFFKYLVATNLLNKSTAWQYEAVQVFNEKLSARSYLITALPPLFVDVYSNHQYQLLPLSNTQEFADKKEYLWGQNINYQNLVETYQSLLEQGQTVFVSNAYLTSQHEFEDHFLELKQNFILDKTADGCLGTCDIYQLKLKK